MLFTVSLKAQLTPQNAVKGMMRGINLGNEMEAPNEGDWNPPIQERAFDDYKNAGFTAIRIPITWDAHTMTTPPYTIDSNWLNRVQQVVEWGLSRGLFIIIDAHHEMWIKTWYSDSTVARFDSIWSQVATRLKNESDSLIFEIINEPDPMSEHNVNSLNSNVLKVIRKTNPTRIVSFSGYMWSNSDQLVSAAIPDPSDKFLIGYYHSYDPYPFGLLGPGTYGSASDIATTKAKFDEVTTWSTQHNIPVILDEFGYMDSCQYNSRMCAYGTVVSQAISHGVGAFAWDDGGQFPIYNRTNYTFNVIKDILIYTTPQSPDGMGISQVNGSSVKIQWQNRNIESDSILIQRNINNGSFENYAKVGASVTQFIDSSAFQGTSFYYRLSIATKNSSVIESYPIMLLDAVTSVKLPDAVPLRFELYNNYPNPFNPATTIDYSIPKTSLVTIKVFDILGREVKTLVNEEKTSGNYSIKFNESGLASGVYFYRLQSGDFVSTKKMLLLK
jgi:hypothetical protein